MYQEGRTLGKAKELVNRILNLKCTVWDVVNEKLVSNDRKLKFGVSTP